MGGQALRLTTLALFCWNTFGMVFAVAMIPMLKREFHASGLQVGLTFGFSAGARCSARSPQAACTVRSARPSSLHTEPAARDGTARVPALAAALHLLYDVAAVFGTFGVTEVVGWRMRVIPQDMIGRVFGAVRLFVVGGGLPGSLVAGWMIETYGVRFALMVAAAGLVLVALRLALSPLLWREHR